MLHNIKQFLGVLNIFAFGGMFIDLSNNILPRLMVKTEDIMVNSSFKTESSFKTGSS